MTSNDGSGDGGTAGRSGDGRDGGVGDRTPGVRPAGDGRVELTVPVDVNVPADVLWEVVSDLEGQSDWMLGTTVEITAGDGRSVGTELRAVTGVGPLGVADTMRVTEWTEPPAGATGERRIVVTHTGTVIRGGAARPTVRSAAQPQRSGSTRNATARSIRSMSAPRSSWRSPIATSQ